MQWLQLQCGIAQPAPAGAAGADHEAGAPRAAEAEETGDEGDECEEDEAHWHTQLASLADQVVRLHRGANAQLSVAAGGNTDFAAVTAKDPNAEPPAFRVAKGVSCLEAVCESIEKRVLRGEALDLKSEDDSSSYDDDLVNDADEAGDIMSGFRDQERIVPPPRRVYAADEEDPPIAVRQAPKRSVEVLAAVPRWPFQVALVPTPAQRDVAKRQKVADADETLSSGGLNPAYDRLVELGLPHCDPLAQQLWQLLVARAGHGENPLPAARLAPLLDELAIADLALPPVRGTPEERVAQESAALAAALEVLCRAKLVYVLRAEDVADVSGVSGPDGAGGQELVYVPTTKQAAEQLPQLRALGNGAHARRLRGVLDACAPFGEASE